ncbi:MAG: sigma-70 family RNA polymerase sigma factor [Coriobacteriales bacterium]|jgi:RNA polymerase sigma factor (sigma-70 family)|nr:sigma-70 family RNA polymerase sigma factor [Coriobacteriales bacterium]
MKVEYTYRFVNGDEVTIKIDATRKELLEDFDREEYNNNRTARRHRIPLETIENSEGFEGLNDNLPAQEYEKTEMRAALRKAVEGLSPQQQELIDRIFFEDIQQSEIAREEGVSRAAITQRLNRVLEKLKKLLD